MVVLDEIITPLLTTATIR